MSDRTHHDRLSRLPLAALLLALAAATACAQEAPAPPAAAEPTARAPLRVVYFYQPACTKCAEAESGVDEAAEQWGGRIRVERFNIQEATSLVAWQAYRRHYGVSVTAPPAAFVGKRALTTPKQIARGLAAAVGEELATGNVTFEPPMPEVSETPNGETAPPTEEQRTAADRRKVAAWIQEGGPWAVVVAGLIDGVNPCAFATIVFLMSAMAYMRQSRRRMAVAGVSFSVGVFVMYTLLGAGLMWGVKELAVNQGLTTGLSVAVAALAFGLAAWSLRDFVVVTRTGETGKATLGLPKSVRAMINRVIRGGLNARSVILGAVLTGALVALLESACTGQVYLPAIMIMVHTPSMQGQAFGYLLLYNLMFILPLLAVLTVAWFGVSSQALGGFAARHVGLSKLALAVLFAGLGVLILATL
jgi:cytochrome c biogenesis protein CcdA